MFPSIEIFGREYGTYGIMAFVGIMACLLVGYFLIKRIGVDMYDLILLMLAIFGGMFIGASAVYGLSNIRYIIFAFSHLGELGWNGLWEFLVYSFGGMVFYGGFIGGGIAILIYTKFSKTLRGKRDSLLDMYGVLVPLFHGFGRIGCFLGGCCYGIESEFGFTIHNNHLNPSINDVNRFPVQLVESACNFILFFVLWYLFRKGVMNKRILYIYLLTYPVIRFSLEFLRGDAYRGIFFGLSTSQWISVILFIFGIVMLIRKNKIMKKEPQEQTE